MKELSLNVLDITMNSVKAKATLINIHITENDELLTLEIIDNGCGMTADRPALHNKNHPKGWSWHSITQACRRTNRWGSNHCFKA